jgi:hypothetical protein
VVFARENLVFARLGVVFLRANVVFSYLDVVLGRANWTSRRAAPGDFNGNRGFSFWGEGWRFNNESSG